MALLNTINPRKMRNVPIKIAYEPYFTPFYASMSSAPFMTDPTYYALPCEMV